ncbi:MAG: PKD domain-containing protein, partial [Saprospiraceae bacterium]
MRFKNLHTYSMTSFFSNVPSIRVALFLLLSFSLATTNAQECDNLTDGGTISGDESGCNAPLFDPSPILSITPATGGSGDIEYLWMKTTGDPNSPFNTWQVISGANGATYDPFPINQTTYYGRCSRRNGCVEYVGETNFVVKSISCCGIGAAITPQNPTICTGESLNLSLTGDGIGFSYLWEATGGSFDNPQSATPIYTMMMPGTYTIKVTITMGACMEMAETTVTVGNQLPVSIIADHTSIVLNQNLPLNSNISGSNLTYSWSTSGGTLSSTTSSNPTYSASTEGDFQIYLEITDENGCSGMDTFDISVGDCNLVLLGISKAASCANSTDGAISITPTGTTETVNYTWEQAGIGNTNTPTNLAAGTYTVTATDSQGCTDSTSIEVGTETVITLAPNIKLPTCSGSNSGQILVTVTGGSNDYTFNWSNGLPDTSFVNNLTAGTYNLTVTDENGCQATGSFQIDNPTGLILTTVTNDADCGMSNGTATVSVAGGKAPYTYIWNAPNNQTTPTAINLAGGTYQVVVIDANGCQNMTSVTINAMASNLVLNTSSTDPTGCGSTNGIATVTVNGGTAPYTYAWNDNNNQTTQTATNLAGGTYQIVVTDANGCQNNAAVTINTTTNNNIIVSAISTDASCGIANGTATVATVTGGTPPYSYAWNDIANQQTAVATNLSGAAYQVVVTDANGCQGTATVAVNATNNNMTVSTSTTDASCGVTDGTAIVIVTGGVAPYTYAWNYAINQQTATATNLAAGTYQVIVIHANACQNRATVT